MKQQILKKDNPITVFLTNFPCHASVVVYCLVLLELTLLQGCFSTLNTLSAFWLLSGTTTTGTILQYLTPCKKGHCCLPSFVGLHRAKASAAAQESPFTIFWLIQL